MRRIVIAAALLFAACNKIDAGNAVDLNEPEIANETTGPESAKVECDVIHERVTQEECDDIRALSKDVREGAAALDVPSPMTRGRKSQVTLVIDRRPLREIRKVEIPIENAVETIDLNASETSGNAIAADANAVATNTTEENRVATETAHEAGPPAETPNQVVAQLPGRDYSFGSQVGRYMKATLVGQGFDIRLIAPGDPVQEVAAGGQASWIWEVVPKEEGLRSLTAKTEAVAIVNGRAKPLGGGQTSKTVTVQVRTIDRAWDFLSALPDWLKLIAAVIGAGTLVVLAWVKFRKAARGDSE